MQAIGGDAHPVIRVSANAPFAVSPQANLSRERVQRGASLGQLHAAEPWLRQFEHALDRGWPLNEPLEVVGFPMSLDPSDAAERPLQSEQYAGRPTELAVLGG